MGTETSPRTRTRATSRWANGLRVVKYHAELPYGSSGRIMLHTVANPDGTYQWAASDYGKSNYRHGTAHTEQVAMHCADIAARDLARLGRTR